MTRFAPVLVIALSFGIAWAASGDAQEQFQDAAFKNGFRVSASLSRATPNELGVVTLPTNADAKPSWRLAQWNSRHLLLPGTAPQQIDGAWIWDTPGKRISLTENGDNVSTLSLGVSGTKEYAGQMRKKGEPWPHLLVEQQFGNGGLSAANPLTFHARFRVLSCAVASNAEKSSLESGLHTAQVSAYWTAKVFRDDKPTGDMFWFGIPFFDARYPIPPGHFAQDRAPGGSNKFISNLPGELFYDTPTGDGAWHTLDVNLAPHLREGFQRAQDAGYLEEYSFEDLRLTSFNLGWELQGPYDATIEIRGLSLTLP